MSAFKFYRWVLSKTVFKTRLPIPNLDTNETQHCNCSTMSICSILFSFCLASVFLISCQTEGEYHICYIHNKDVLLLWEHVLQMQNAFVLEFSFFLFIGMLVVCQYKNALEDQPHVSPGPGVLRGAPRGCPCWTSKVWFPLRDFQLLSHCFKWTGMPWDHQSISVTILLGAHGVNSIE